MMKYLVTPLGRLRLLGFLEGTSLLILLFIAMPIKYMLDNPLMVKIVGQIHGILFILFVLQTIQTSIEYRWKFTSVTWKVLLASFIPFGTFYVDSKILSKQEEATTNA